MFKKILFPTDFSDVSKKAVGYIKQLKGAGAQEVIVLHVIDDMKLLEVSRAADQYLKIKNQIDEEVAFEMDIIEKELTTDGFQVRPTVKIGTPFKEIMSTAAGEKVSLIVMGSHGRSNVEEILLGSVSENVVRHAKVPVLMISREI